MHVADVLHVEMLTAEWIAGTIGDNIRDSGRYVCSWFSAWKARRGSKHTRYHQH